jgi:hypothetical protein
MFALQCDVFRSKGIWLVARAVGVHLSPRPFFVLARCFPRHAVPFR